jgi:hypothetical protein
MAVVFSLNEIDTQVKKDIQKELTMIPVDPYEAKITSWGRKPTYSAPKVSVQMYTVDTETKTVRLPFNTAMIRMGEKPNRHKKYPKLCEKGPPKFSATLRPYQIPIVEEALQQLKTNCTTTLGLPPASGKTIMGAYLGGKVNGVILTLVHRVKIGKAHVKTFKICYPKLAKMIWFVDEFEAEEGIPDIKRCTISGDENELCGKCDGCTQEYIIPAIIICMNDRISKIPHRIRAAVKVLIVDEAHLFCTPCKVECLLCTEPQYVIAETATLNRKNGMASMIKTIVGEEGVFRIPDKPHRVYRIKTGIKVELTKGARGTDFTDLTKKLIENGERNLQVVNCILCNPHRKIIIMVRYKAAIPILVRLLQEVNIEAATLFGNKEEYSDSHVLIGTIPKMGVGFDEANSCTDFKGRPSDLMILLTSLADQDLYEQVKGRVMRSDDPVLFYFEDKLSIVKKHIDNVVDWIEQTKGVVIDFPYDEGNMGIANMEYTADGEGMEVPIVVEKKKKKKIVVKSSA